MQEIKGEIYEMEISGRVEIGSDLNGYFIKINGERINVENKYKAEYIKFASSYSKKIKIPKDEKELKTIVKEYGENFKEIEEKIKNCLERTIPDRKLRDRVGTEVWRRIFKRK